MYNAGVVVVNAEDVGLPPGTDVMIFKIFSPKNSAKKLAFLTQNKAKICKILIVTLVFEKNANFFAENLRKSQKIVIITSIPDNRIFLCKKTPQFKHFNLPLSKV
jgi:hypothetical protein